MRIKRSSLVKSVLAGVLFVRSLMKWSDVEMGRMVAVMSRECVVFCHFISNKPNNSGTSCLTWRGVTLLNMFLVVEIIKIMWTYIIRLNWKIKVLSVCPCVGECWVLWFDHFIFKIHNEHIVIVVVYVHTKKLIPPPLHPLTPIPPPPKKMY